MSREARSSSTFGPLIGLAVVFALISRLHGVLPSHWEPSGPGQPLWSDVSEVVSTRSIAWQGIPFLYVRGYDGKIPLMYARHV